MLETIPTDADELDEKYTVSELRDLADDFGITGRWDMTKAELIRAIRDAQQTDEAFQDVTEVEEGDIVTMNHLKSDLMVTDVIMTEEYLIEVIMETNRGGRHKLVWDTDGEETHLERWRANDQQWMRNSTDPTYFERAEDDEEE